MAVSDYSTTPASNTSISLIDITGLTGKVKFGDDAIRQIMADVKAGVITGYTTTATAAGTTTLTVASNSYQYFTGVTTQTITMPVTSTLELGRTWVFVNNSTGALTINSSGANLIATVASGDVVTVQCILLTGTTAASWAYNSPRTLTSTDAGATSGPELFLDRNSASPSNNDTVGLVSFRGRDSGGNLTFYGGVYGVIADVTNGSEDGGVYINVMRAGTEQVFAFFGGAGDALTLQYGQITFPAGQNASSNANTLDDYEEGSATPTYISTGATFSYGFQILSYTKVGNRVSFEYQINLNASGNTFSGNPITVGNVFTPVANAVGAVDWSNAGSAYVLIYAVIGASNVSYKGATAASASPATLASSGLCANSANHVVSGNYRV